MTFFESDFLDFLNPRRRRRRRFAEAVRALAPVFAYTRAEAPVKVAEKEGEGDLDIAILKMWRHSAPKSENLDPLVELLILAIQQVISLW